MELKKTLGDYTQDEFKSLVSTIWNADLDNPTHTQLIDHFDKIIGDPLGADLLFYPPYLVAGTDHCVDSVVFHVKQWHNSKGRAAFHNEPAPAPPGKPAARLSPQERKVAASNQELEKVNRLVTQINAAAKSASDGLLQVHLLLDQWQAQPLDSRTIAGHIEEMSALETAQSEMVRRIKALEFLKLTVEFARSGAQRNLGSPFRDPGIQAQVLGIITQGSDDYLASVAGTEQRHRQVHERCTALFLAAEDHLVRRLSVPGVEPGRPATLLSLSSRASQLRPGLMFADEIAVADPRSLIAMKTAIRSAIAEFSWQATSLKDEHPGTFAGVVSFYFEHWKARSWYVASVPLDDLMPTDGYDWQGLARSAGEVDLPYRLFSRAAPVAGGKIFSGLKEIAVLEQVCLTPTTGGSLSTKVKVVAAQPALSYRVSGSPSMELRWSTASQFSLQPALPVRRQVGGVVDLPETPLLESLAALDPVSFDDCILVFPPDSGLGPLYLMFKRGRGVPL